MCVEVRLPSIESGDDDVDVGRGCERSDDAADRTRHSAEHESPHVLQQLLAGNCLSTEIRIAARAHDVVVLARHARRPRELPTR